MILCRREYGIAKKKVLWHSRRGLQRYYANISLMCDNCREYQRHADDPSEVGCRSKWRQPRAVHLIGPALAGALLPTCSGGALG